MKVLFLSNLFPDAREPRRGLYNARMIKHLAALAEVRVIAPRPTLAVTGWTRKPIREHRPEDRDLRPLFPAVPYIPRIGSRWNHRMMAWALRPHLGKVVREFQPEIILSSWIYPDSCAVAELLDEFQLPCISIAQGSDIHQYLGNPVRRAIILQSLAKVNHVITRSQELARLVKEAGIAASKVSTIYNGVELDHFSPGNQATARRELGLPGDGKLILYVGNFYPVKAPDFLVETFSRIPDASTHLIMVGAGPLVDQVKTQITSKGLTERVHLMGSQPPEQVAKYFRAADLLCVPSVNEGVPNVILEAFASGLPVVAGRVGGIPEIVTRPELGKLVDSREPAAWAKALAGALENPRDLEKIRAHGQTYSWSNTARAYLDLLQRVTA